MTNLAGNTLPNVQKESFTVTASDGYVLGATRFHIPESASKAVVLISTASGVKQSVYFSFASFLATQGFMVLTYDYRGVGQSLHTDIRELDVLMSDWGKQDMTAMLAWIQDHYPEQKILLVTNSIGGVILGLSPLATSITAALMVAPPNLHWRYGKTWLTKVTLLLMIYALVPIVGQLMKYLPMKPLGLGESLPKSAVFEWIQWAKQPDYLTVYNPENYYQDIQFPIRVYSLSDDGIASYAAVRNIVKFYSNADLEHIHLDPQSIQALQIGHIGFFKKTFQNTLWQEVYEWLSGQL